MNGAIIFLAVVAVLIVMGVIWLALNPEPQPEPLPDYMLWKECVEAAEKDEKERQKRSEYYRVIVERIRESDPTLTEKEVFGESYGFHIHPKLLLKFLDDREERQKEERFRAIVREEIAAAGKEDEE